MKNIKLSFKILKQRMVIFGLILAALFVQEQIGAESTIGLRILITAIGVDKAEEGYEVSAQIYTPSKDKPAPKEIISEKGPTIGAIMDALVTKRDDWQQKKPVRYWFLARIWQKTTLWKLLIIFAKKCYELEYDSRGRRKSALETLKGLNEMEKISKIDWADFSNISEREFDRAAIQLRSFAKGVYGLTNTAHCILIGIEETKQEQSSQGGGSGGEGSGGGQEESNQSFGADKQNSIYTQANGSQSSGQGAKQGQAPQLKTHGKTAVFVKGKQVLELNKEQTEGTNWINPKAQSYHFMLEGLGGYYFGDSKVTVHVFSKSNKIKSRFDDKPQINFNISARMELVEVMRDQIPLIVGKNDTIKLSQMLIDKTKEHIQKRVKDAYYAAAEKEADVFNIVPYFYKFHTKNITNICQAAER